MHDCPSHNFTRTKFLTGAAAAATLLVPGARALAQTPAPARGIIDIHHHYYPAELMTVMQAWQANHNQPPIGGPIAAWTAQRTLAEMDATGIQTAILSLASTHGIWFEADPKTVPALVRTCNDYAAKMVRDYPGRFGIFAALPMPDVAASLVEVKYAFDTLHADGIGIPTSFGDKWPGDQSFEPLWAELNKRKAMVVFHPYVPNCCGLLQPGVGESYLEYPYDTGRTFLSLLFSGTLAKYKDVKWTFCHGGGTLPFLLGRIKNLAENSREKLDVIAPAGIEAMLQSMYFDTANATYAPTFKSLAAAIPMSQIMFGTDYPYVTGKQNLSELLKDGLSPADLLAIESGNAKRVIPRLAKT